MLVSLLQFYILLIAWMLAQCQASCDSGWFGRNCTFMCHCSSSETCDDDGQCPNNGQCKSGFFGPGCQYVDVLQQATSDGAAQYLRDGNDTTCNPEPNEEVVAVSLAEPVPITWFRVALKDKTNLLNFTTTLNEVEGCKNEKKFPVSDTLVDVSCKRDIMMTSLKISGPAAGSICSLYISGGRNVALRQTATQSSVYVGTNVNRSLAKNAVDGHSDMNYDHGHCSCTNNEPPNWWMLTFSQPQTIYKVIIHNRNILQYRLKKFLLEAFDEDKTAITVSNYSETNGRAQYDFNISTEVPVVSLNITQLQSGLASSEQVLTICEVEAFGDPACPVETYGFYCEKKCQCNRTDTCHPFSGACGRGCQPGFYGHNCSSRCFENCLHDVCELYSGNCIQCVPGYVGPRCDTACDPGRFGPQCGLNCSDRCADNECTNTNGRCACKDEFTGPLCKECSGARHGNFCEHNCSNFCGNSLCERYSGECLTCVGNRLGPFCEDCPWRYFGPLCDSKCNPHCLNRTCDPVSGKCFACEEGYEGKFCRDNGESNPWWLISIPIVAVILFLLVCTRNTESLDEDEE